MMYRKIQLALTDNEKRKLPFVADNEEWIEIFSNRDNENLKNLLEEFQKLKSEEESLNLNLRALQKDKKKAMGEILAFSDELNNDNKKSSLKELDKRKRLVESLNMSIEDAKFNLENLPKALAEVNYKMLLETVEEGYKELSELEDNNKVINEEMIEIRDRLRDLFEARNLNDARIEIIYTIMHGSLGANLIEKVDERVEKEDEDGD